MVDQEQSENKSTSGGPTPGETSPNELADELRELGNHIKDFLHALWESQDRKRVQQEVESGLTNLGASFNQAAKEFQQSPTGQRVKEEFEEIGNRIRTGEMETTLRRDFMSALQTANRELEKVLNKMAPSDKAQAGPEPEPKSEDS
jgi:hypothetical protein